MIFSNWTRKRTAATHTRREVRIGVPAPVDGHTKYQIRLTDAATENLGKRPEYAELLLTQEEVVYLTREMLSFLYYTPGFGPQTVHLMDGHAHENAAIDRALAALGEPAEGDPS